MSAAVVVIEAIPPGSVATRTLPAALPAPRVILVDAETVTRQGLPLLIPGMDFVGCFPSTESLIEVRPTADVVILDVRLGGPDAVQVRQRAEAVRSVVDAGYRVCIYTAERGRHLLVGCLNAGASAIVHKSEPLEALTEAIRTVAAGQITITRSLAGLVELAERRHVLPSLTDRQAMILSARARGEKFDSIARRLFISKKVAEEHWGLVARKFSSFLSDHSAADLERLLGLEPGEVFNWSAADSFDRVANDRELRTARPAAWSPPTRRPSEIDDPAGIVGIGIQSSAVATPD